MLRMAKFIFDSWTYYRPKTYNFREKYKKLILQVKNADFRQKMPILTENLQFFAEKWVLEKSITSQLFRIAGLYLVLYKKQHML